MWKKNEKRKKNEQRSCFYLYYVNVKGVKTQPKLRNLKLLFERILNLCSLLDLAEIFFFLSFSSSHVITYCDEEVALTNNNIENSINSFGA